MAPDRLSACLQMTVEFPPPAGPVPTYELVPDPSFGARQKVALRDLAGAARMLRLAWTLALLDIRQRYRGSMLGPFWLTLSTGVMVGSMGIVYGMLFGQNLHEYLPYLALSLVLWGFVSAMVAEGCQTFLEAEGTIRSVRLPYALFAWRVVLRNLLVLAHNILVIIVTDAALRVWPGAHALLVLPGLALWLIDSIAISLFLGAVCARFRDIPPIVASIIQMAFFISAVIWKPAQLDTHPMVRWLLNFDPFYSILEVVRAPLLGEAPTAAVWISALVCSGLLCGFSWLLFVRVRGRIAFWI